MTRDRLIAALHRHLPGALQEANDRACVLPRSTRELSVAVRLAQELGARLSTPGADETDDQAICIDLRRMTDVITIDDTSRIVHAQAGISVIALESELAEHDLSLACTGPTEDSIGVWLARGAPGARDHADDPVDQLVAGLEVVLANGRDVVMRPAPRRAVGPDLASLFVGGRGRFGIITGAHLVVRRRLHATSVTHRFPSRRDAEAARAWIRGRGVRPAGTALESLGTAHLLTVAVHGEGALLEARLAVLRRVAAERGGTEVEGLAEVARAGVGASNHGPTVEGLARRLDPAGILAPRAAADGSVSGPIAPPDGVS